MIALLGSIRKETDCLLARIEDPKALNRGGAHLCLWRGRLAQREVLLARTGMGKRRAEVAGRYVLQNFEISGIVSFGFCGALTNEHRPGDVVVCTELTTLSELPPLRPGWKDLEEYGVSLGRGVTVDQPVTEPANKRRLGRRLQADIVDMESYWIGRLARRMNVPFFVVRVVIDGLEDRLPDFSRFVDDEGTVLVIEALRYLFSHPSIWAETLRMRKRLAAARRSLADFIETAVERF